jgi:signal transduction histidine kinase
MSDPSRPVAMGGPVLVAVAFAAVATFVAVWFPRAAAYAAHDALRHKATTQARLLAHSVGPAIDFGDTDAIDAAFTGAQTDADFVGAQVLDVDGRELSRRGEVSPRGSRVVAQVPVPIAGRGEAHLVLALSITRIDADGERHQLVGGVLGATILGLGLLVAGWVARSIRRITALSEAHERERRRAAQASEVKSRFLGNRSHEMRTPLNGVLGLAEVLSRRRIDAESAALMRAIARSGRTLLALVNDILDLSRVQAEQILLEHTPFNPEAAAAAVCEMLQAQARTKSIDLALRVDESLPREVVGDRLRFEQVLTNLVGNAVRFTSRGHVRVALRHRVCCTSRSTTRGQHRRRQARVDLRCVLPGGLVDHATLRGQWAWPHDRASPRASHGWRHRGPEHARRRQHLLLHCPRRRERGGEQRHEIDRAAARRPDLRSL